MLILYDGFLVKLRLNKAYKIIIAIFLPNMGISERINVKRIEFIVLCLESSMVKILKHTIKRMIVSIIVFLLLLNGLMYLRQPDMVFYPLSAHDQTPRNWGLEYEDVFLDADDEVRLHGWFIPREGASKVVLFFHGNAGNISHRGESVKIFHRLGLNVFIIDYRGYGKSTGKPGEKGMYADAKAAWNYLNMERAIYEDDIIIFGRSLGGVVASQLASEVSAGKLIIESTFSSSRDMARRIFPVLSHVIFMRYCFSAVENIKQNQSPVLVAHSPDDDIIPFSLGEKIFQNANEPKRFLKMRGDHNSGFLSSQPEYEQELRTFIFE